MKRRLFSVLICAVLLCMSLFATVSAEEVLLPYVGDYREKPMDLSLMETMNSYAKQVSQSSGANIVVVLYDTVAGTVESEAAAYLKDSNFKDNTVLLMVAEQTQTYTVYTVGATSKRISETEKNTAFAAYNEAADYEKGIRAYVDAVSAALNTEDDVSLPSVTTNALLETTTTVTAPSANTSRLVDEGEMFSSDDEKALSERLDAVSAERQMDVRVAAVAVTGEADLQRFAENCFTTNAGEYADGVMLLLYGDEWDLYYHGGAATRLGDDYKKAVDAQVSVYTLEGNPLLAADMFIALTDRYLSGKPVVTTPSTVVYDNNDTPTPGGTETIQGVGSVPSGRMGLIVGCIVAAVAAVTIGVMLFWHFKKKQKASK